MLKSVPRKLTKFLKSEMRKLKVLRYPLNKNYKISLKSTIQNFSPFNKNAMTRLSR